MSDYHEMAHAYTGPDHHQQRAGMMNVRKSLRSMIALQNARIEETHRQFSEGQIRRTKLVNVTQHAMGYIEGLQKAMELLRT